MKKIIAAFMCLFIMACSLGEIKTAKAGIYTSTGGDYGTVTYSLTVTGKTRTQGVELYYVNSKVIQQKYYNVYLVIDYITISTSIHYKSGGDSISSTTVYTKDADWDSGSVAKSSVTSGTEKASSQIRVQTSHYGYILKTLSVN